MMKDNLALIPNNPGCYLFKDKEGFILYVGKAKDLKNRVNSYFVGRHYGKTKRLLTLITDIEYIITNSESEALILELNLIKKYQPKFNILLRDDKMYPYIELTNELYPRLLVVRKKFKKKPHSKVFGPYPNVYAAKQTVQMLNKIYPLRKCQRMGKRECLYYHINECVGYCVNKISPSFINQMKKEIISFLKGHDKFLIKKIKKMMNEESLKLNFEKANELKRLLNDIKLTIANQPLDLKDVLDFDLFGYASKNDFLSIQVFHLRGGKLVSRASLIYKIVGEVGDNLTSYIVSFYDKNNLKPDVLLVPDIIDVKLIEETLDIKTKVPRRGKKKQLLLMACDNAKVALKSKIKLLEKQESTLKKANESLAELFKVNQIKKIEIFDNSHLFGTFAVSGMVVFVDGEPSKKDYRKYKITSNYNDDYHFMKEVIYRRYFRLLSDNLPLPDLIIVDGGKAQLKAALEVLNALKLNILVCGLKKDDKHLTNSLIYNNQEFIIDKHTPLFYLLAQIQNEVHRFTINYHRQLRSKGSLESILDQVKGIGQVRKENLLRRFKTITELKKASLVELEKVVSKKVALALKEHFN